MAFTRTQLVTLTKQLTGNRTNTSTLTDAWYQDRVASGYRRLCTFQGSVNAPGLRQPQQRRLGFFELEDRQARTLDHTTITTNFVTPSPSTDVVTVIDIYDRTHHRGLDRRSRRELLTRNTEAAGIPRTWCPAGQGGVIGYYINQIPSATDGSMDISVFEYVYKYPTVLAGDSSVPVIPDVWHIAIAYAAGSEAAMLLDNPEKHTELEGKFIGYIAERKSPMEEAAHSGLAGTRRWTPIGPRM